MRVLFGVLTALLSGSVLAATAPSEAGVWRQIREGNAGYTAVSGRETDVLIQATGADWLYWRNELIAGAGAWALATTVFALALFFLFRGQVKLTEPRSGELIPRWSGFERWLHFFTAVVFLALAFTGLTLLYGRPLLIDLLGHEAFSEGAQIAKILHNYLGPLFIVGLSTMAMAWFRDNLPTKTDWSWFKQFGGMIGDRHPSAGRMNGGEKAWFWLLISAGLLVSVSGLMLDFNSFGQPRFWLQISHGLHTISALLLMVGALGHIYIGTIGTEGALEGMTRGHVDAAWARQHHDLWYQELQRKAGAHSEDHDDNT